MIALGTILLTLLGVQIQPDPLAITFLDVGQGDAILIRSPEGKVALVDAGPNDDILSLLRRHAVGTIDVAVATHPHADHIGGMEAVIRSLPVRYYMDNGMAHTTATYSSLLRALRASGITYLEATERTIELGSVTLRVFPPPDLDDHNNNSIGLLVEYGDFKAMLTGDAEIEELNHFIARGVPRITVLKASHHGSRDAVSPAWLSATKPQVIVISCGADNAYGYPDPWALRYYEAVASEIFRTDLHGDVTVLVREDGTHEVRVGGKSAR